MRAYVFAAAFAAALIAPAAAQTPPAAPQAAPVAPVAPVAPTPVAQSWSRYASASEVQMRDVAALVRITPENRTDIAVSITNPGPLRAPELRVSGRRLIIDGKQRRQIRSCRVDGATFEVTTRRQGRLREGQLPIIELRVPQAVVVAAGGAVRLHMAPAQSAHVRLEGCGDADLVRVENDADISVSGAPDLRLYDVGEASIRVAGAGDVVLGVVRAGLTVSVAGAGDIIAARADGPTNIAVQGSGDVIIRDGRATTLSVAIAGTGDVTHNGSAERLDAVIFGGGDVRVRQVSGEVTRRVLGGGDVIVGR
jgi:hypothetical protein